MTKQEILNGMSEAEFYALYPTKEAWEQSQQMSYGGSPFIQGFPFGAGITLAYGGTPYYGGPIYPAQTGIQVPGYDPVKGSHMLAAGQQSLTPAQLTAAGYTQSSNNPNWFNQESGRFYKTYSPGQPGYVAPTINTPTTFPAIKAQPAMTTLFDTSTANPVQQVNTGVTAKIRPVLGQKKSGGMPCYDCGGPHMEQGGGLSRSEDYGSKKKPYPSVSSDDFAGGGRSYPIPTRADAIDALRLASLHGRGDVKAKVYAKYPDLKKEFGGAMTQDLQGQYPSFGYGGYDFGGPFNYGSFPAMSHGGDITTQGANQDYLKQRTGAYNSFIQNNVLKSLQKEESQKVQDAFMQMEYGMHQMPDGSMMPNNMMQAGGNYGKINPENAHLQNIYAQLAETYGPHNRRTGLPLFPANMSPYYGLNKRDAKELANVPAGFKANGLEITEKYGLLGRNKWLRENFGIGPKSINYKISGKNTTYPINYNRDNQVQLRDPNNPLYNPNKEDIHVILDSSRKNNFGPEINPTPNPNISWDFPTKAKYGLTKYQSLGQVNPIDLVNDTTNQWNFAGNPAPIDYKKLAGLKDPQQFMTDDQRAIADRSTARGENPIEEDMTLEGKFREKWKGVGQTIGQYAVPGINALANVFETEDRARNKKKLQQSMLADNTFLNTPLNAKNRGDYDLNSGMFRPDNKVPVQFPGYFQWGGFNTMQQGGLYQEGEELDLSPEEIAELKAQGYQIEELD